MRWIALLGIITILLLLLHVGIGSYEPISPLEVIRHILAGPSNPTLDAHHSIVWDTRLPRAVMCLLIGALLGVVGSAFQALLRNPLADPYIIGVSSGAAVGGSLALVLGIGTFAGGLGMDLAGFVTGLLTLAFVYALSRRRGVVDVRTLLLAGVVTGSLLSALQSLILLACGKDENQILRWLLGNTAMATWPKTAMLSVALIVGASVLMRQSRKLNAFALGGETAQRLGVDVPHLTRIVLVCGAAMTAAAVGAAGIVGFVGLVAPHIARRLMGVDWRWSLPGSLFIGSGLLLASDLIAQRALSTLTGTVGLEIPVGVVTALVGAPSLLILLRQKG